MLFSFKPTARSPSPLLPSFLCSMTTQSTANANRKVLWIRVWSLALVQGAIALMWVIYNLYLLDLLTRFGFPAALATGLLIVENLLAMVMEPLMGSLSDRLQQRLGTRFPIISLGVILAAGAFVGIPVMALIGWTGLQRWILPLMLIAWALAMTVFRSPAMSLLGRYAFATHLPQAASVLTLVGAIAGAMGPFANELILSWGPLIAFAIGSGVLLLATVALRWTAPTHHTAEPLLNEHAVVSRPLSWSSLALVFGAGIGITFGFRALMLLFSTVLTRYLPSMNSGWVIGAIFIALSISAIPAGALAVRLGNFRAMILGLAILTFVVIVIGVVRHGGSVIALALMFGAAYSLVSNGVIPFALSMVPASKAGLGTGLFFSGAAAASSLFGAAASSMTAMPLSLITLLGVLALLLAGGCIMGAPKRITTA